MNKKETRDKIDKPATTTRPKIIDNSKERAERIDRDEWLYAEDCIAGAMKLKVDAKRIDSGLNPLSLTVPEKPNL